MEKEGGGDYSVNFLISCHRCQNSWVDLDMKEVSEICPFYKLSYCEKPKERFKKGEKKK